MAAVDGYWDPLRKLSLLHRCNIRRALSTATSAVVGGLVAPIARAAIQMVLA